MTCNDCIHKDVCYKIEHYGRDLKSEEPCEEYVGKMICLNHIDEAIHKFNDFVMESEKSQVSDDKINYVSLFNLYFAIAIMNDMSVSNVKALAQILLAESTKNDNIDEVN